MEAHANITPHGVLGHSQITIAGFVFLNLRQAAINNDPELKKLGYSAELIQQLKTLSPEDVTELSRYGNRIIKFDIDEQHFNQVQSIIEITRKEKDLIDNLLLANAPYTFMNVNFGFTSNDVASRRHLLKMGPIRPGRPKDPSEAETEIIVNCTRQIKTNMNQSSSYYFPTLVLAVTRETSLDINKVIHTLELESANDLK